ncbi:MAG TPA: GNAT family N-acetyltransferase [Methylomirabilota bacterium]|nr:GNAT family N-acetyltransferase [Methylomirabilota bacterium]
MSESIRFVPVEVELRNGRRVRLREIRPDDREEIRQAFGRLSSESRYTRFMASMRDLTPRMLDYAVSPQGERELGLVAEIDAPDGIDIVGGARYYVQGDRESCEFAITVVDDWQGTGLASRLMLELIQGARARALTRMEGLVLAGNRRMLRLAERLGFSVHTDPDDAAVKIVRIDLTTSSSKNL